MKAALVIVILIGSGIGLLLPREQALVSAPGAAEPAPAPAAAAPARAAPARPAAAAATWGGETRLARDASGHFFAQALVNGQPVHFVVDTGASTVALTEEDARRIGLRFDPARFDVIGSGASGPVRGQIVMLDSVSLDGKAVRGLPAAVLEGLDVSLLGQAYLTRLGSVIMRGDEMILR